METRTINIGRVLKAVATIITLALLYWYVVDGRYWSYLPTLPDADALAERLVEEKRKASDCFRTYQLIPSYPPLAEARFSCVREYAKLTKDPSACELLMPSGYGLSCVGGAKSTDDVCHFYNGDANVYWDEAGDAFGKETIESCQHIDPAANDMRNRCCLVARVAFVKSENDCSSLKEEPDMHDECLKSLAFKNHEPAVCAGIANANTKSACIVNAEAIKKNPSICSGCKVRVEKLDQLK